MGARKRLLVGREHAAKGGHLDVLQWALANGCPGRVRGGGRSARCAAVGASKRLSVGRKYVRGGGGGRAPRCAAVGARERMPVERDDVRVRGKGREIRVIQVGARKWLHVDREMAHLERNSEWTPSLSEVD